VRAVEAQCARSAWHDGDRQEQNVRTKVSEPLALTFGTSCPGIASMQLA